MQWILIKSTRGRTMVMSSISHRSNMACVRFPSSEVMMAGHILWCSRMTDDIHFQVIISKGLKSEMGCTLESECRLSAWGNPQLRDGCRKRGSGQKWLAVRNQLCTRWPREDRIPELNCRKPFRRKKVTNTFKCCQ